MNSTIAIGTVGSGLKLLENREQFYKWLEEMIKVLKPTTILIYDSTSYPCFEKLKNLVSKLFDLKVKHHKTSARGKRNE